MGESDPPARVITAVRHWSQPDVTRVAIEVTGPFKFHSDRLHNPERVYYDIVNSHVRIESKGFYVETIGDTMLEKIRVAENTPGTTRVVLDLNGNAAATTTTLTNPDRLIIELRAQPTNPLRTEAPLPEHTAAPPVRSVPPFQPPQPVTAVKATSAPPVLPPAPVAAAKTVSTATKLPVKTDVPVVSDIKVPGLTSEAAKPLDTRAASSSAIPVSVPVVEEFHPVAGDPGPAEVAKAAHATSDGTNSLIRTLGLKLNRVVIDPGHGGHDQGTEGTKGLLEKDVVLDVALRVGKLIQDKMGAEVIYTRSDDTFVPLEGRTALANEKKADLFLSIHANSSAYPNISGVETYYLNITGTKDAIDVAKRENGTTHDSIFDLQDLVKKIALHDKSEESREFAKRVEESLFAFNLKNFPANKDRGVKTAPFIVLIGANMPSVLAEIGFLTNSKEESLLKTPAYRQKLAEALYKGIEKYSEGLSHFQAAAKP